MFLFSSITVHSDELKTSRNHIYKSSLNEISLTSNRIFDEFLITPAGKRSLITPPSSSCSQQSSSFSIFIGDSSTADETGEDEQDAAGEVEVSSFLAIFDSSPLSLFNFDFLKDEQG